MITDSYDVNTEPVINLKDFYGKAKYITDLCLVIFSEKIHTHLLKTYECKEIGVVSACNGNTTIYKMDYKGRAIAFYLSAIGSAIASGMCCEANHLTGVKKFIMFGSCGSLNKEKTKGKFIIPTESYRGEGCSYYYAAPADYITIKNSSKLAAFFEKSGIPYVCGKVWTTETMLRETAGLVAKRKAEGCIAVDMELAGVQAVCDFYNFELFNFLEAGDVLAESSYEIANLNSANHDLGKLYIALEAALQL